MDFGPIEGFGSVLNPGAGAGRLVANVWGNVEIVGEGKGLADLRCLQTVGGNLSIQGPSGQLEARRNPW